MPVKNNYDKKLQEDQNGMFGNVPEFRFLFFVFNFKKHKYLVALHVSCIQILFLFPVFQTINKNHVLSFFFTNKMHDKYLRIKHGIKKLIFYF